MIQLNKEELLEVLPANIIETRELTQKQKIVLAQLIIYNGLEQTKNEGFFYRSNKDLISDCGITEMTLLTAIRKLDAMGFIERKKGKRGVGASEYRINEKTINDYYNPNTINYSNNYSENYSNKKQNYSNNYSNQIGDNTMINNELIQVLKEIRDEIRELRNTINYSNHYNKNYSNHSENYSTDTDTEEDIEKEIEKENNINNIIIKDNYNNINKLCTIKTLESENIVNEELMLKELEELECEIENENVTPTFENETPSIEKNDTPADVESVLFLSPSTDEPLGMTVQTNKNDVSYEQWRNTLDGILNDSDLTYEKFLECTNRKNETVVSDNDENLPTTETDDDTDFAFGVSFPKNVEYRSIPTDVTVENEDVINQQQLEDDLSLLYGDEEEETVPTDETEISSVTPSNETDGTTIHQQDEMPSERQETASNETEQNDSNDSGTVGDSGDDEMLFKQIGILLQRLAETEVESEYIVKMGKFRNWLMEKGINNEQFKNNIIPQVQHLREMYREEREMKLKHTASRLFTVNAN